MRFWIVIVLTKCENVKSESKNTLFFCPKIENILKPPRSVKQPPRLFLHICTISEKRLQLPTFLQFFLYKVNGTQLR